MSATKINRRLITELDAKRISLSEAVRKSGRSKNAFFRLVAKGIMRGDYPDSLLEFRSIASFYEGLDPERHDVAPSADEVARLKKKLSEAQARAREVEAARADDQAMLEILAGLNDASPCPPNWITDGLGGFLDGPTMSTPMLLLGDVHYGEVVRPKEAGGYRYNAQIAEDRMRRTVEKSVEMARVHLAGLEYPGIILGLLGDMTSGALHPELAESDEYGLLEAVERMLDLLVATIDTLRLEFGRVFVPTAVGNHGRFLDRKPRMKGYADRNTDRHLYKLLARHYRNDDQVTIMVPEAGETIFKVYGREYLLTHGDQIGARGGDGIIGAMGPITRGTLKTTKSLNSLGHAVQHVFMGHWHQSIRMPQATVNGCPKGPDEFALKGLRAAAEDPSQTLCVFHPDHGLTFQLPIYLRDEHCPDRKSNGNTDRWIEAFEGAA